MSFVRIWIHAVWGTKSRGPILDEQAHELVCEHILKNATEKGYHIDSIDGAADHLHSLMALNADLSISKQMQLIKGESSHWINKNKLIKGHFEWGDEYFAVSVSEKDVDKVRAYIRGQKEHHKKKTFSDEYNDFLKHYKFNRNQG